MNYELIYDNIIKKRKRQPITEGYFEIHHILPKSIGGTDNKENLVSLTAKEHFICHLLLTKMYPVGSVEYKKMIKAFIMMENCISQNQKRYNTPRKYEKERMIFAKIQSELQSGIKNSQYGKKWYYHKDTLESKKFMDSPSSEWIIGRKPNQMKSAQIKITQKKNETIRKNIEKKIVYTDYYRIYNEFGFNKFCEITGWKHTKQNLVSRFSRHVEEFVPQNGKRRGSTAELLRKNNVGTFKG